VLLRAVSLRLCGSRIRRIRWSFRKTNQRPLFGWLRLPGCVFTDRHR